MTFEELVTEASETLVNLGAAEARYKFEPNVLGDQFPAQTCQYRDDATGFGGSDEEFLPDQLSFRIRFYYPIRDIDVDDMDGMQHAQLQCLKANSAFRSALWENPSLSGLVMMAEITSGRGFGVTDEDHGSLYVHELDLTLQVH